MPPVVAYAAPGLALPESALGAGVSARLCATWRAALSTADRRLAEDFKRAAPVRALIAARAELVDAILLAVWRALLGDRDELALIAVGGFGRRELHPHSDVDLLVLTRTAPDAETAQAIEQFFARLWDIGLKPGQATRTAQQCHEAAAQDITVLTALMEARLLAGPIDLFVELSNAIVRHATWPSERYLAAKIAERQQRNARFHDTAYNLEPNLKEGPGGLRDLQLVSWLALRQFGDGSLANLAARGFLSADELIALRAAQDWLWRVRFALHLLAGRAEERLLFDHQRALARDFGFADEHAQNLGVEQFMQCYFRAAMSVERLTERLLQRFAEESDPPADSVKATPLNADFQVRDGLLEARDAELFLRRPAALIELYWLCLERPQVRGVRSGTIRLVQQSLPRIDQAFREDAEVNALFLAILRGGPGAAEALARMHRHGVLARYLPPFGRVAGRMQYDLFHVYTVDQHTLFVLRNLARFGDAALGDDFPLACDIHARLRRPELVLLAGLFHDIAKGRGGDHSELGEIEACEFCARLGLSSADADLVAWLVRHHLLMSVTAQRQDIADPDVVHRFATQVGDWERLDCLYLLTVADISATSPKLWNSWKDRLLADLYAATRYALRRGLEHPIHASERGAECKDLALAALSAEGLAEDRVAKLWADFPDESFLRYRPEQIAWQTAAIARTPDEELPLVLVKAHGERGTTEVFVYSPDRDGLFATVTATLDRLHLNVVEARVVNSRRGISLDTFHVLDQRGHAVDGPGARSVARNLRQALLQAPLRTQPARRAASRQQRHFQIAPRIEFSQDPSSGRTQLALVCSDRPGLLASVALALRESRVRVHDARIATFGERVEDFFLISDENNRPLIDPAALERLGRAVSERVAAQLNA